MEVYSTKTKGVGGAIKQSMEDFVVEEVLVDGSKACVKDGVVSSRVLGFTLNSTHFLLCVLIKRNWDTFMAVKNIAKSLGIAQTQVQFAGIKDAKAVTAQYISIANISAKDAQKINVKDVQVRPLGYIREPMSLFYLLGNSFTITVRNIHETDVTITENITKINQEFNAICGIPNFFGHQRFGTTRPITHLVGKALIKGDFEEAAMLFLAKPSIYEHPSSRQARQELERKRDFKMAKENFPKHLRFEKIMLNHLADNPGDFAGAFQKLPPKLQALFVQAHQSYLFNRFLSKRVKAGLPLNEAVVGDYVVGVERSGLPLTAVAKVVSAQTLVDVNIQIKAGRLRVALPIFGLKQKRSQGVMGQLETEVLEQEGIEAEKLKVNVLSKNGGRGGLRTVVTPIKNFRLQKVLTNQDSFGTQTKMSFMLLRGSYATVVLREIMKPSDPIIAGF
jgi:tRNA pseudouridine13 synthase